MCPSLETIRPGVSAFVQGRTGSRLCLSLCKSLLGFDDNREPQAPQPGWPVFRFGRTELEIKKGADGEPAATSLTDWALKHRFTQPGTHQPLTEYTYAEHVPADETVP